MTAIALIDYHNILSLLPRCSTTASSFDSDRVEREDLSDEVIDGNINGISDFGDGRMAAEIV